jgi:hypothetical protein
MSQRSETKNIILGFFLLLAFHIGAAILIFSVALLLGNIASGYITLSILIYGFFGFSIWQLIYVIPLCLGLKKEGKISIMKGVIIAAIFTFLINGGCFLITMTEGILH